MPRYVLILVSLTLFSGGWLHGQQACVPPGAFSAVHSSADQVGAIGNWFLEHKQPQCARNALRHGIDLYPNSAPLHYSLGLALLSLGASGPAQAELEQTLRLDPRFDRALLVLGTIAHDRGLRDEALKRWQQAAAINPSSVTALDWIAKTRIEAGQFTEAIDLLTTAPEAEDLAIDYLVAANKASLQEQGIARAEQALTAHPEWTRLSTALATILVQLNRYEEALKLLLALQKNSPYSGDLQALTLRVLLLTGDVDAARPIAERLLEKDSASFDALYLNGLLDRQTGSLTSALPLLQQAVRIQPDHFDARYNLGVVYAKLHRLTEARQELSVASEKSGAGPEVHFQLASVLRASGDTAKADGEMTLYRQALADRAQHDELVSMSAQAAQKLNTGDTQGAAAIERGILTKAPTDAVHWYDLALALDRMNDFDGEKQALERALQLRPSLAVGWNQLGYLLARKGDVHGAEAAFRNAIKSAPQYAEAQNNLGSLLAENDRDSEAQLLFRAALSANPRLVDGWINLAASLAATGQFDEARQAAQSALTLQPTNPDIQRLLAMLNSPGTATAGPR